VLKLRGKALEYVEYIDSDEPYTVEEVRDEFNYLLNGTYGHEQRHVRNYLHAAYRVRRGLAGEDASPPACVSCDFYADSLEKKYKREFDRVPRGPDHEKNPLTPHPKALKHYPPLTSPPPKQTKAPGWVKKWYQRNKGRL
jgi:hypothetical protein